MQKHPYLFSHAINKVLGPKLINSKHKMVIKYYQLFSRNFIKDYWMKLKTNMAIHDMLQNHSKQASIIPVVMDNTLAMNDIPLELQTLSPILKSSRFYMHRLKNAFAGWKIIN